MRTWLQSQSSSSATIIGSEVFTPWPISGFFDTIRLLFHTRSDPDRTSNPVVAAAAADVTGHGGVNLLGIGLGCLPEQRARGHDLPGLTVAALHHINFQPSLLQSGADRGGADMLDRVDLGVAHTAHRQLAGASRCPIHMDGAGAAEPLSASILGADQSELVAQHPQQRHVRRNVDSPTRAIDIESIRHTCTL